jgi:signal transduction histidine kinase
MDDRRLAAWPLLVDAGIALLAAAVLLLWSPLRGHGAATPRPDAAVAALLLAGAALPLAARRRRPLLAYGGSIACTAAYLLLGNPPGPVFVAPLAALTGVIEARPARLWVPAAAAGDLILAFAHTWSLATVLFAAAWLALAGAYGAGHQIRRDFFAALERSREQEARRLAAEQRLRIAREMHDVLGHSLAVISLQAGVAEHLLATRPEEARAAVAAIRQVSRDALGDLRGELAALRGDAAAERAPAPGVGDLPALVEAMRQAGLPVDLELQLGQAPVPELASAAAYRIVQEALTNVVRHAGPGVRATVMVRAGEGRLRIEVADDGPGAAAPREGNGLTGMRERALVLGGTFAAGNRPGGGFRVEVALPA